jgi:hypothetical protein
MQVGEDTGCTHDRDDQSYNHGYQVTAPAFCFRVGFHILRNSLLDVRQPDVGSPSADTTKLVLIRALSAADQGYLTNREVVLAWTPNAGPEGMTKWTLGNALRQFQRRLCAPDSAHNRDGPGG